MKNKPSEFDLHQVLLKISLSEEEYNINQENYKRGKSIFNLEDSNTIRIKHIKSNLLFDTEKEGKPFDEVRPVLQIGKINNNIILSEMTTKNHPNFNFKVKILSDGIEKESFINKRIKSKDRFGNSITEENLIPPKSINTLTTISVPTVIGELNTPKNIDVFNKVRYKK